MILGGQPTTCIVHDKTMVEHSYCLLQLFVLKGPRAHDGDEIAFS